MPPDHDPLAEAAWYIAGVTGAQLAALDAAGYIIVSKAENTKLWLALDAWKKHREVGCACKNPTGVALANISGA